MQLSPQRFNDVLPPIRTRSKQSFNHMPDALVTEIPVPTLKNAKRANYFKSNPGLCTWKCLPLIVDRFGEKSCIIKIVKSNPSCAITSKPVTSLRGRSLRCCARVAQFFSKICRSGGDPLATLCLI